MTAAQALVIGSGPSAVAAAASLIDRGIRPTVIDGGRDAPLEALKRQEKARARVLGPDVSSARFNKSNPGQKDWFGSNHPFSQPEASPLRYQDPLVVKASYGVGGLSRVWGGTFAYPDEWEGWPRVCRPSSDDLALVRRLVPAAHTQWPMGESSLEDGVVRGARSSGEAMRAFMKASTENWRVRPSTVAIDTRPESSSTCVYSAQCLTGCPNDAIWFAGTQIRTWKAQGLIEYMPGHTAVKLLEGEAGVIVHTLSEHGPHTITAERVFVAAGPLATGGLLIASGLVDRLTIRDTATAFLAALSLGSSGFDSNAHHLSQWWVTSLDDRFSAQVYAPDRSHVARLAARAPQVVASPRLLEAVAARLHPVIAYLDSRWSDDLYLSRDGAHVRVEGRTSRQSVAVFKSYLKLLRATFLKAGYIVPLQAVEFTAPGTGYHSGASMPHGATTDAQGRLSSGSRVHVVDSSVIPRLHVGSITPTVMVNAARIARVVADEWNTQ